MTTLDRDNRAWYRLVRRDEAPCYAFGTGAEASSFLDRMREIGIDLFIQAQEMEDLDVALLAPETIGFHLGRTVLSFTDTLTDCPGTRRTFRGPGHLKESGYID